MAYSSLSYISDFQIALKRTKNTTCASIVFTSIGAASFVDFEAKEQIEKVHFR